MSAEPLPADDGHRDPQPPRRGKFINLLNILLFLLVGAVGFLTYSYFARGEKSPATERVETDSPEIIQLDVLNGCGVRGAGAKITSRLRSMGFDVVEMKNYSSFDVPKTLVIDRIGSLEHARRVARALGIDPSGVVQQINPDYFVDVSVIVGGDYATLERKE